jgi:hypothetical protein
MTITIRHSRLIVAGICASPWLLVVGSMTAAAQGGREPGGPRTYDCLGYLHRDFAGPAITQNSGRGWKYVGDRWNDQISSFRMRNGCRVVAYQHRDYKGESTVFRGDYRYVGDLWNDQISSFRCICN